MVGPETNRVYEKLKNIQKEDRTRETGFGPGARLGQGERRKCQVTSVTKSS